MLTASPRAPTFSRPQRSRARCEPSRQREGSNTGLSLPPLLFDVLCGLHTRLRAIALWARRQSWCTLGYCCRLGAPRARRHRLACCERRARGEPGVPSGWGLGARLAAPIQSRFHTQ
eukprot:6045499-Prymnesium_polylepis.1